MPLVRTLNRAHLVTVQLGYNLDTMYIDIYLFHDKQQLGLEDFGSTYFSTGWEQTLRQYTGQQQTKYTGCRVVFPLDATLYLDYTKGSPTVAKSRTPYLKSHLKSLKSLKFQNLKSRTVETVISKFLYISASNHVKIGRTISNMLLVKVTNHETS